MTRETNNAELRDHLWTTLEDKRIGMLGLAEAGGRHMQPMTAHAERETQSLWFFAYNDSELAEAISRETLGFSSGMFCLESGDHSLYACIAGAMHLEHDLSRIEKYWGMTTAAWFPQGRRDPRLTMIRFDMQDAHVWHMDKGRLGFLFEVIKANLTNAVPDSGIHAEVKF